MMAKSLEHMEHEAFFVIRALGCTKRTNNSSQAQVQQRITTTLVGHQLTPDRRLCIEYNRVHIGLEGNGRATVKRPTGRGCCAPRGACTACTCGSRGLIPAMLPASVPDLVHVPIDDTQDALRLLRDHLLLRVLLTATLCASTIARRPFLRRVIASPADRRVMRIRAMQRVCCRVLLDGLTQLS